MSGMKKYVVLIVGGSIALVLAIFVIVLLVRFSGEYARIQRELQSNLRTLEQLHNRDPFPSVDNVEVIESNLVSLENYRESLLMALSAAQPEIEEMERATFPPRMERTAQRLRQLANQQEIRVADTLDLGFGRYAAGNLPVQEHVSRLVSQLQSVEHVVTVLFEAGISELISVEREVFDVERMQPEPTDVAASRRRMATAADTVAAPVVRVDPAGVPGLYSRERFTIVFFADDLALRQALNALASDPILMVVRNLELRSELGLGGVSPTARLNARLQPRESAAREGATTRPGEPELERPLMHEDRVVAGRERVRTTMTIDVFRFEAELVESGDEEIGEAS